LVSLLPLTPNARPRLWEWEQSRVEHLLQYGHTFLRHIVHCDFRDWEALARANTRLWEQHYRCRAIYEPWGTWEAWLAEFRTLIVEAQAIAEEQQFTV
jgi:hypothetical protein